MGVALHEVYDQMPVRRCHVDRAGQGLLAVPGKAHRQVIAAAVQPGCKVSVRADLDMLGIQDGQGETPPQTLQNLRDGGRPARGSPDAKDTVAAEGFGPAVPVGMGRMGGGRHDGLQTLHKFVKEGLVVLVDPGFGQELRGTGSLGSYRPGRIL